MKSRFFPLMAFLWVVVCVNLHAAAYSASSLPSIDDRTTHVSNPDGILRTSTVDSLNQMLLSMDRHDVQCMVVCIKRIEDGDPYSFAIGLGRRFGVGGKRNLGIVVVLATEDRAYHITTGRGMEKYLPDAICARIANREMMPHLKNGDWDAALLTAVQNIKGYLEEEPEIVEHLRSSDTAEEDLAGQLILFLLFGGILLIFVVTCIAQYKQKKCPQCKKHKLKKVSLYISTDKKGYKHIYRTYKCQHCHYVLTRESVVSNRDDSQNGGGFIIFGGGHTGGFSSGNSSGGGFGGFGGGSFGGGGAGGRF